MSSSSSSTLPPTLSPAEQAAADSAFVAAQEKADEYKETWLKMWSNSTNPKQVSCVTAVDIVAWCFGPANQLRHLYRTGMPTVCREQMDDVKLCLKVVAKSASDHEAARALLRADREAKQDRREHIWKMRTEPPKFFRAPMIQTTSATTAASTTTTQ